MSTIDIVIPCFEIGGAVRSAIDSLMKQQCPAASSFRIILVDDGSSPRGAIPDIFASEAIVIVRHTINRGRAAACNTGMRAGSGDLTWFLDADCVPETQGALEAHLAVIADHDVSVGPVRARQAGFWGAYQNRISNSRVTRLRQSMDLSACTSANLMARRGPFEAVAGFSEKYTQYGFEDRDFFERAHDKGLSLGFAEAAMAFHDADLNLVDVCRKMGTAGRSSSGLFRASHPDSYRRTPYGKLDARDRGPAFRAFILGLSPCLGSVKQAERTLEKRWIPFSLRAATVKAFSGLSYAKGTLDAFRASRAKQSNPPR